MKQSKNFWEENAEPWAKAIANKSIASRSVTSPALINEILRLKVKSILDVGCGEGWLGRALPERIGYCGIDGSEKLIEKARETSLNSFEQVTYQDLREKAWTTKRKFNAIVFNFSLFEEEISDILKITSKFLSADGFVLIQTLHPCFQGNSYQDSWQSEDFKSMSGDFKNSMPWFQRTLQSWFQAFAKADLTASELIEPSSASGQPPSSIIFLLKKAK